MSSSWFVEPSPAPPLPPSLPQQAIPSFWCNQKPLIVPVFFHTQPSLLHCPPKGINKHTFLDFTGWFTAILRAIPLNQKKNAIACNLECRLVTRLLVPLRLLNLWDKGVESGQHMMWIFGVREAHSMPRVPPEQLEEYTAVLLDPRTLWRYGACGS